MTIMDKDILYDVIECDCRNELIDAITKKSIAICIGGELREELYKELKSQISVGHKLGTLLDKLGTANGVLLALSVLTGGGVAAADFAIVFGSKILGSILKSNDFENYVFSIFLDETGKEQILLFNKKKIEGSRYNFSGYTQYKFLIKKESECPVCKNKISKEEKQARKNGENPFVCPGCKQKLVWVVSASKAKTKMKVKK